MKTRKKAIGYVCDIPIKGTDMVISKEDQRLRLLKYAQNENLALVHIFEDDEYNPNMMSRPGIKAMLDCREYYDVLLVERIWCFSRRKSELEPFLDELDKRNIEICASSYLWDCLSQQIRHRYMGSPADRLREKIRACTIETKKSARDAA